MSTEDNPDIKAQLNKFKKKKKVTVPKEFLENANSYDAKLAAVRIIADREKSKVMLILKRLLTPEPPKKEESKPLPKPPAPPPKKKGFFGK